MDDSMKIPLAVTLLGLGLAIAGATALFGPAACLVGGVGLAGYGLFGIDVGAGDGE